jgi:hypothetical protein
MANADADRISLDLKSNFAAIAAARPIPHLELLYPFIIAVPELRAATIASRRNQSN